MAQMEVILLERVANLGQMGEVVKVKPGFARNFLLPQKKALRATEANRKYFESRRAQLEADNLKRKSEADSVAAKLQGQMVTVIRQAGETGQLYGSVNARDVAEALTAAGFTVEKKQAVIEKPIKAIGIHDVRIVLHPEVAVAVKVNVGQSEDEAKAQAERFARGENPVVLTRMGETEAPAAPAAPAAPEAAADAPPAEAEAASEPAPTAAEAAPAAEAPAEKKPAKAKKEKKAKAEKA
jgi:large subunit ribosomal protein L9